METFKNKTVLITGASSGIGLAIASKFVSLDANVILVARNKKKLKLTQNILKSKSQQIWIFSFDLSRLKEIQKWFKEVIKKTQKIDILINNAGTTCRFPLEKITLKDWQYVIDLNLTSIFLLSQSFARQLIKRKSSGKIINITSLMAEKARPTIAAYIASKGGLAQLTKAMALELAKYNINVNAIGPGYIKTELTKPLVEDEKFSNWVKTKTPFNRWGQPSDIVGTAIFLASSYSDFITGQTIYVDGGWLAAL